MDLALEFVDPPHEFGNFCRCDHAKPLQDLVDAVFKEHLELAPLTGRTRGDFASHAGDALGRLRDFFLRCFLCAALNGGAFANQGVKDLGADSCSGGGSAVVSGV